ncbi:MAG: hypothetical protein KJ572_09260 [Gammaproteobacteria bacterium]|nr:hypothetical protein [Gammaproteobacteria bacterium]
MDTTHTWKFFRAGGFDQVQLDSGADLLALKDLNQKLWVALSCPVHGIEFDDRTLEMVDTDGDGQVRANEVLAAISWAGALLKDADLLTKGTDSLLLADIDDAGAEGRQVLASARLILNTLGKRDASHISLAEMTDINKFVADLQFNGDGVICAQQVDDPTVRATVEDIVKTAGSVADVSGDTGINQEIGDKFFADAAAYAEWFGRGETDAGILPLGTDSDAAALALQAVRDKIDDYFIRCQMAAYDERAALPLSRSAEDYQQLAAKCLSAQNEEVAAFPLATIAAGKPLALHTAVNPAWQDKIDALCQFVLQPLLGERQNLTFDEWKELCTRFDAFADWQKANPAPQVGELGIARVREILSAGQQARIDALIAQDKALAPEIEAIHSVERLIRYQRDLFKLVNNFVSFREFYSGKGKAVFQVGTLYLDGRSCEMCVKVDDVNAHATFANSSGVCLIYCELVRQGGSEKMNIAAAFTAGDADFLAVGRHGIFYDRKGQDWNATIVRINDHPISIRQAFWSPYKKLSKTIAEQLQKFAASKAGKVQDGMTKAVTGAADSAPKPAFDVAKFAGIFAAIGLAIGAIGGILASVVGGILSLEFWQIPLAVIGLMLAVSLPSMALAWFKLKKRNLGPILDACGWAINARALINIPFGTSLTGLPKLPEGAQRALFDPYAEKRHVWPYLLGLLVLMAALVWAWYAGYFE